MGVGDRLPNKAQRLLISDMIGYCVFSIIKHYSSHLNLIN